MALVPGTRIGPYEISAQIGAGGMGEVYRAIDTNLKRAVAIKVLPEMVASDADRLARLQREAEVLASLNHPNIAQIYGLEKSASSDSAGQSCAIVMEFVDGATLADRIAAGPIPIDEALAIARQIAEALEAAHEQGIVHRDLKPANVKLRPDGQVRVLDFGLAKLATGELLPSGSAAMTASPTLTIHATFLGVILGTAAYMSPEQAKGKMVDRRADIWAFGVVLCEMLTGRRMYDGETAAETLARIIEREPDLSALPSSMPAAIRIMLERCLTKDPRVRLQAIGEARILLERAIAQPHGDHRVAIPASDQRRRQRSARVVWTLAGVLAVALIASFAIWAPWRKAPPRALIRMSADIGADTSLMTDVGTAAVLSPDGQTLVFAARKGPREPSHLYVRRLDQLAATELAGTDDARSPFFSPDGSWIAFFATAKLKKVAVAGGAVVTLTDAPVPRGGSWAEDGTITYQPDIASVSASVARVSAAGGTPTRMKPEPNGRARYPQALPGGRGVLYTRYAPGGVPEVMIERPDGERRMVMQGGYGRYLASGHIVYLNNGTLFAVAFDLERLQPVGQPIPVVEGIMTADNMSAAQFSVSDNGTLAYLPGEGVNTEPALSWLEASGKATPLIPAGKNWANPRFSPDGTRLAMDILDGSLDIWTYDLKRGSLERLTFDGGLEVEPVWTPDGRRIVYRENKEIAGGIVSRLFWRRTDLTKDAELLVEGSDNLTSGSWHPSGKYFAFHQQSPRTNPDIWVLPVDGDEASGWKPGKPTPLVQTQATETDPQFSPDGKWLAYTSNATGITEVFVRPFPGSGGPWQISSGGGGYALWSQARHELFYATPNQQIMVASYRVDGESFVRDPPRLWSETRILVRGRRRSFDVHPDGNRIVAAVASEPRDTVKRDKLVFVFNFFDELRRLAPVPGK